MRRFALSITLAVALGAGGGVAVADEPAFAPVDGSPFQSGKSAESLAFSPNGKLLATANSFFSAYLSVFSVSGAGRLTLASRTDLWPPLWVGFSPDGKLLAANGGYASGRVAVYSVSAEGKLTPVPGSPYPGPQARSMAFSPSGKLLAVPSSQDGKVLVFSVAADGTLRPVPGSPFAVGPSPGWVTFSPDGKLLATVNTLTGRDQSKRFYVNVMSVSPEGKLTVVGSYPSPGSESVQFSPDQRLLAAANYRQVVMYSVAAGGGLTEVSGSPFSADEGAGRLAFTPDGSRLATAGAFGDHATVFSVAGDGTLTPIGAPLAAGDDNRGLAFSPTGGLLAVSDWREGSVSVFAPRKPESPRAPPAIGLRLTSSRRTVAGGGSVRFRLTVANRAWTTVGTVRTCVVLPRALSPQRAIPRAHGTAGRYCWIVTRLGSGRTREFTLTARLRRGPRGWVTSRATATATGSAPAHARATVRIR